MPDPVLQSAWDHVPWYVRLLAFAAATFGAGYGATSSWQGGLLTLGTWILGSQTSSPQQTRKEQKERRGRL